MGGVLVQLIPLIIGSAMMPTWVLIVLLLLRSKDGLVKACAFVGGVTVVRLVQGAVFGTILSAYHVLDSTTTQGTVVSVLLLLIGVVLWVMGLRQLGGHGESARLVRTVQGMVNRLTPLRAMGLGVLLVITSSRAWIFTLTAVGVIDQAHLPLEESIIAFLLYVLGAQCLLVGPVIASARSSGWLDPAASWLDVYSRPIGVVVSLAVGTFFLWRGLAGLIG